MTDAQLCDLSAAMESFGRALTRTVLPRAAELGRIYDALPREVKIAIGDPRATPIRVKQIRRLWRRR